jgi:hypothetical protein
VHAPRLPVEHRVLRAADEPRARRREHDGQPDRDVLLGPMLRFCQFFANKRTDGQGPILKA